MKLSWNLVWQGLASVGQVANFVSGIIPAKDQPYVALVLAISQAAVAWRSHYFNPDGTPAASAYTKSK